jgi:hypothetical protein
VYFGSGGNTAVWSARIAQVLVVVLFLLSSRTPISAPYALIQNAKRHRPSKQSLPTQPVRAPAARDEDPGRGLRPHETPAEPGAGRAYPAPVSTASGERLVSALRKPEYLQHTRASCLESHPSLPA